MFYDCIVIGKGLIGSAAAKYLSRTGAKVAIVGPDEPSNYADATVFVSHYDQARIQRQIGLDEDWTILNKQSVKVYPQLEADSGIGFHEPIGCLYVQPNGKDDYLEKAPSLSKAFNIGCHFFDTGKSINQSYTCSSSCVAPIVFSILWSGINHIPAIPT